MKKEIQRKCQNDKVGRVGDCVRGGVFRSGVALSDDQVQVGHGGWNESRDKLKELGTQIAGQDLLMIPEVV